MKARELKLNKDINYIQALEKAVREKYGDIATMNPKHFWDENKEKEYIEETKKAVKKEYISKDSKEKVEIDGIMVSKRVLTNSIDRTCKHCGSYSFKKEDDLYLNKYKCCYKCYVIKEEK